MDAPVARPRPQPDPHTVSGPAPIVSRWRRWTTPYRFVATMTVIAVAIMSLRRPWNSEFWLHATAVDRLSRNMLDPGGLQVFGGVTDSSYYSPYSVALAMVSQLTGLSAVTVVLLMAPVTTALLCYGFARLCRWIAPGSWFRVFAWGITVALWGLPLWPGGGYPELSGLPSNLALPAGIATAMMLLAWAQLLAAIADPRVWRWIPPAGLATLILLVHLPTAAATILGAAAILIWRLPELTGRTWCRLAIAALSVTALAATWPYYSMLETLGTGGIDTGDQSLYRWPWAYLVVLAIAAPALWLRWRRDRRDVWLWLVLLSASVVAVGAWTGYLLLLRQRDVILLAAVMALAAELYARRPWRLRRQRGWLAVTTVACVLSLLLNSGCLLLSVTPGERNWADYGWLMRYTVSGDVVICDDASARRVITGYGLYSISPGWQDPMVSDIEQRRIDERKYFDADTGAVDRRHILERWSVDWILDVSGELDITADQGRLVATGPDDQRLYAVEP